MVIGTNRRKLRRFTKSRFKPSSHFFRGDYYSWGSANYQIFGDPESFYAKFDVRDLICLDHRTTWHIARGGNGLHFWERTYHSSDLWPLADLWPLP